MKKQRIKKQHPLTAKVSRQIEILQKYYDIDVENRVINLTLYYEKASDILLNDITTIMDMPRFNEDVLRRISEILDTFPTEFKVNLSLQIDNYEGYKPEALLDALKDSLEMFNYAIYRDKGKRWLSAALLVFVSVCLLYIRLFAGVQAIIDTEGLAYEMLDIIAWVFLWQAVTIMFLTPNELRQISYKLLSRLLSVAFIDKEGKSLVRVESKKLDEEWLRETKKEKTGRILMLISGTAFLTIAFSRFIDFVSACIIGVQDATAGVNPFIDFIAALFWLITATIYFIGGLGAISTHRGKGPFMRVVKLFAILSLIIALIGIAAVVLSQIPSLNEGGTFSFAELFKSFVAIGVVAIYFIGFVLVRSSAVDTTDITQD